MRYRHLILANLLRKKVRTALTLGSFAVALFLFGLLAVIRGAFEVGAGSADRLVVMSKVSPIPVQPLPVSYRDRILRIPGVKRVTSITMSPAWYQQERNFFAQVAVDTANHRALYSEYIVPDDQWAAFVADREGCIIGERMAMRFNWKVGDRIPIRHVVGTTWEFNVRGICRGKRPGVTTNVFWYQQKLLEERALALKGSHPAAQPGHVGWYIVRVADPNRASEVVKAIDQEFANSPRETATNMESGLAATFANMMGNVEYLILSVGGVVFFTLLLVTGNTMAIAVRERVGELAVLKAVGYSDVFVLALVLIESMVMAALGGALGLGLAKLFTLRGDPTGGLLARFDLPRQAITSGLALALLVGVASGTLPALSAMRLRVVQALRRV